MRGCGVFVDIKKGIGKKMYFFIGKMYWEGGPKKYSKVFFNIL